MTSFSFLLFSINGITQSQKGFRYLKKKQYEKARTAFEKDQRHPLRATAALFGLSQCSSKQYSTISKLKLGYELALSAQKTFVLLSPKQQRRLRRYEGLNKTKITSQIKSIQRKALKNIRRSNSILELDLFIKEFPIMESSVRKDLDRTRREIIRYTIRQNKDYASLSSLAKNHYEWVGKSNFRFQRTLQDKIFETFLKEYGIFELGKFVDEHPDHSFSKDCWIKQFTSALNEETGIELLRFLNQYPYSTLDRYASMIFRIKTKNGRQLPKESDLLPEEIAQVKTIKKEWEIRDLLKNDSLSLDALPTITDYIKAVAPSSRGYDLMQDVLQKYLVSKRWKEALIIIISSKSLFPDKQPEDCGTRYYYYSNKEAWFDIAIPIIEKEATGVELTLMDGVNSENGEEYSPVISADGQFLYFAATGRETIVGGEDIFASRFDIINKVWGKPKLIRSLSTEGDEAPLSITADGNEMLLFKNGKLHLSKLTEKGWSISRPVSKKINTFPWIGRATLSADGQALFFSASLDPEIIYGESNIDIYISERDKNGEWLAPIPLDSTINTPRQERSPFLAIDKETLYFSSNGHDGLGGMDVFMSKRKGKSWLEWSKPINLGKEINTLEDDWSYNFSLSANGETAYLSSDDFLTGRSKIFATGLPKFAQSSKLVPILARINRPSNAPLETTVVVTNSQGKIIDEIRTRPDGSFTILANPDSTISFYVKDDRFFPDSRTINVKEHDPNELIEGDTLEGVMMYDIVNNGKTAPLNNIHFDHDSDVLIPLSYPELKRLYSLIVGKPWKLEIIGHTDNEGTKSYNKKLSLRRAKSVRTYLNKLGYPIDKMITKGYGFEKPKKSNKTEEGKAQNRRVEVRFIK